MKNDKLWINFFFVLLLVFSLSYAQEMRTIQFKTGSLQTHVDIYRGNFSVYDVDELDLDFVSYLFGGSLTPSSFFNIFIDRKPQTLDQMQVVNPLGISLGSQIDGTYMAGEDNDIQVDIAFFALDLVNTGDLNSVGLVINLSNTSGDSSRKVGAKILLDTDLGESRNDPLIYLPNGVKITNSFILGGENIPSFLFVGQKDVAETRPIGKGFYVYPYLSKNLPSSMIVANWRRLTEQQWNIDRINPSLSYTKNSIKDAGISICFGDISLRPNQSEYFGIVISKLHSNVWPVLQDESISKGVLNDDRFEVEELLKYAQYPNGKIDKRGTFTSNPYALFQQKREQYRLQQLYSNQTENRDIDRNENITNLVEDDTIWRFLYQLDWNMNQKTSKINSILSNRNRVQFDTNYTIFKDKLFEK